MLLDALTNRSTVWNLRQGGGLQLSGQYEPRAPKPMCVGWAITGPLDLGWKWEVMADPAHASFVVSPHEYWMRCHSGPLAPELEAAIDWESADDLRAELNMAAFDGRLRRGVHGDRVSMARFIAPDFHLDAFGRALMAAERGVMGIRTSNGLWCQAYERGWPRTPPFCIPEHVNTGLLAVGAFSPARYLPFTRETVEAAVPEPVRDRVTIDWHDEDDIVPPCTPDPRCVLHRENFRNWL